MLKNTRFTTRTLLLLLMSLLIILPTSSLYAQDNDDYDDDYYDDEYYDDEYYDDDYYDDYYDDDYYDDDYYDDDYYDDDYYDDDDYDDDYYDDGGYDDEEVDASYEVDGVELLGDPTDDHLELWDSFVAIIPDDRIDGTITFFEVISSEDTTGYVYGDEDDLEKFVFALSTTLLDEPRELEHTIIHEYGHIATLNADQIDIRLERGGTCSTFELDEGCSDVDSYVYVFYATFYEDAEDTEGAEYNEDNFVTDYAASNIAEDMAESFTFFILDDQPTGDSIAEQKVNFFYNFTEMVELRDEIRENLDNFNN